MNYLRLLLLLFIFYTNCPYVLGQELPPIEDFIPESTEVESQNWSISQGDNKYLYAGNNKGLLEFNGKKWTLYPTPNKTVIRSVKVVNQKIYTGFYMNFGFWKRDEFGNLNYTSISDKIKEQLVEDEQFWHIIHQDDRILFQSLNRIYIYNTLTDVIDIIDTKHGILGIFKVDNSVYFQNTKKGLFKIENGEPVLVNDLSYIDNDIIVHLSLVDDDLLLITRNNGFYRLSGANFSKIFERLEKSLEKNSIFSALRLADGSFVLGTISEGILIVSPNGAILYSLNQYKGLSNNTVLTVFEDHDNNIWLGLDNGINCINITSPVRIYPDYRGKIGTVYTSAVYNEYLYIGSNQGVFFKPLASDQDFEFIQDTNGQVWDLFIYDNTLFCGHDSGTFIINKENSTLISDALGGWNFKTIPGNPNLLLQGTYNGLVVFEKNGDQWSLRNKIEGFDISCRYMEFYQDYLWVNHEYRGVYKLSLNQELSKIQTIKKDTSIVKGDNSNIVTYDKELLYTNQQQTYFYNTNNNTFDKTVQDSRFKQIKEDLTGKIIKDNRGNLWVFAKDYLGQITESQFSEALKINKIPIPKSLRKEMLGFENINHIQEETFLIGTTKGYINLEVSEFKFKERDIILDKVQVKSKDADFKAIALSEEELTLPSKVNTISFGFTIPEYDKYIIPEFQYTLEGFYKDWSKWTTDSNIIFENLPPGDYTFKVRAKTGDVINSNELSYAFTIDRPWYASTIIIIAYMAVLIVLFLLINRAYKEYYAQQKSRIVEENKKKLELKQLENEKAIMELNNEKLRQDIESKNRELASYTMSIIKKNEILNSIKKELQKSEKQQKGLKGVERVIDQNLNNKDDWKHFEEALNNLDKDFLKRLKAKHPDLTPNDLRFCSFLRLNLSSKEIAPLLNISVRSVEIKRYRLRKKLNLDHSDNLVNYILEV
ncbi:helix-turn-helix and ligand-binding sensor domain-containing protein [Aquimarina brevivitae]|uniref:Two component regulator with propeller domain n=1 Tax=Aquimarina brevivitae TaxID=323412 RepID=A0A4Q7PH56_9FLAO|nr:triple tyrosine motif-containing protein [Aquimarina brevivitae]RZS99477.1 two component regulator with propeller domain [Aquimarina brevivitae]